MQEEIENRTVNLVITTSRLSVRALTDGLRRFLNRVEQQSRLRQETASRERIAKAEIRARRKEMEKTDSPHGKQTIRQLIRHSNGLKQVPVQGERLKEFERVLKRYGVDFAIMKETAAEKPRFLVFFKAKDEEVLSSVLADCTWRQMERSSIERPSILKLLAEIKEKAAAIPRKDRIKEKDLSL